MKKARTFFLFTLGCKTNQYDSQNIRENLASSGLLEVKDSENPDVCIINGCAVTRAAEAKCRRFIKRFKRENPASCLFVTGCMALSSAQVLRSMSEVDEICPDAFQLIERFSGIENRRQSISDFKNHTRAFLKIQDGCESYCSYCIVPYLRGPLRSRPLPDILEDAERLADAGFREIVLTGIHLGKYGADLPHDLRLSHVIEKLEPLPGITKIRLSSIEPKEFAPELIETIRRSGKVCPHFHVPLQSGDEEILKRMNRNYSPAEFLEVIYSLRQATENPSFTTDIMVGFPGETEEAFQNTVALCRKVNFSRTHVFPFSPRKGTPAAEMKEQVAEAEKKKRTNVVLKLADEMALSYKKQFLGKVIELLVLGKKRSDGLMEGVSPRYMFTHFKARGASGGDFVNVKITGATPKYLLGQQI